LPGGSSIRAAHSLRPALPRRSRMPAARAITMPSCKPLPKRGKGCAKPGPQFSAARLPSHRRSLIN